MLFIAAGVGSQGNLIGFPPVSFKPNVGAGLPAIKRLWSRAGPAPTHFVVRVDIVSDNCQPPYTITAATIRLISDISEQLGRLSVQADDNNLRLRRINRIRTIQGSLAIEGNTGWDR